MAIERVAQNVDFGNAPQAGAIPMAVNDAQPDVNKYMDGNRHAGPSNSLLDNLVNAALPVVNKLAAKEVSSAREEAYLNAASAAGAGLAEDQVKSNIFTKDWATAGYHDTRARLAQADAEAQTAADMQTLREQSPSQFQDYLAQRRQKLLPMLEGMSLDARKSFLAQQLTSDRAAIAKHAGEHQKFVIDQLGTAVQTDMSVRLDAMTKAKTDPSAYLTAADDAYAGLYGNIWNNPALPKDVKLKLTEQAAQLALANNHQVLYEHMRDSQLPGTKGSMLDQLPFDSQYKLAKGYEQSLTDTANMRLSNFAQQWGLMQSSFDNPLAPPMSHEDFAAMRDQAIQNGMLKTPEAIAAAEKAWADGNEKKMASGKLAGAYASGDVGTIFAMGKSESDGYSALIQTNARNGVSIADTSGQLLQIGLNTGQQSAFKGVGELTRSAVAMIGAGQTIDPNQLQMLNTVLTTLDQAQAKGNTNAMSSYLSAFGDADRAKIMMYREELQRTGNPTIAAANAADTLAKTSQLSDTEKNVLAANHATADRAIVDSIEPRGLWGTLVNKLVPDFARSNNAVNTDKITTGQSWFENPDRVQQAIAQSKVAVMEELNYISRSNPYASDDTRKRLALAAVADRTLQLNDGPLVLPHLPSGTTVQSYFGVNQNIRPDVIASAINDLHTPGKDNRVVYKIDGQSRLQWQELGKDGAFIRGGAVDPKSVAGAVQDKQDAISERFAQTDGPGITVKGSTGVPVTFNGNNTAGLPNDRVLDIRKDLVKFEDVRDKAYDDASGKVVNGKKVQTVGVGVSSTNDFFPQTNERGVVDQKAINESFTKASNAAIVHATKAASSAGRNDFNTVRLFTQLAYQGGSVPGELISKVKAGDREGAMQALFESPQYKLAHTERRVFYANLMQGILPVTH